MQNSPSVNQIVPPQIVPPKDPVLLAKYDVQTSEKKDHLGSGAYGCVMKGTNKATQSPVAIKKMLFSRMDAMDATKGLREISILRMLKGHPYIVELEFVSGLITNDKLTEMNLVFELMEADLYHIINSHQELSKLHIQYFLYQILHGIHDLHAAKLVHRDLKPANILVKSDCTLKICDFTLARAIEAPGKTSAPESHPTPFRQLTGHVVTSWYRSPELILNNHGAESVDMWSIGCILGELFLRNPLFPAESDELLEKIFSVIGTPQPGNCAWINEHDAFKSVKKISPIPDDIFRETFKNQDADSFDLLEQLLQFNPDKRISAEQALQHNFITQPKFDAQKNQVPRIELPIQQDSDADLSSRKDYYDFEIILDNEHDKSSKKIEKLAYELIQKEIARYKTEPEPEPVLDDACPSAHVACSIFSPRPPNPSPGKSSPGPGHDNEGKSEPNSCQFRQDRIGSMS